MSKAIQNPTTAKVEIKKVSKAKSTETKPSKVSKVSKVEIKAKVKQGPTIYQSQIFDGCKDPQEKKRTRIKLRRSLNKFYEAFIQAGKDNKKLAEIRKEWNKYAQSVYRDTSLIIDHNATAEHKSIAARFIAAMTK